jgi:hypothetical protein
MSWHYVSTDYYNWAVPYGPEYTDNAREVWNYLLANGWTENAASAVIGNFQHESFLNPGQWEIGRNYDMSYGMGLGQWTPATKVSDYVGSTDRNAMADGNAQMGLLLSVPSQYSTYYLNPDGTSTYYNESGLPYIDTMAAFSQSNASRSDLTKLWAICWERPGSTYYANSIGARISDAEYWYNELHGSGPTPAEDDIIPVLFFTKCIK